MRIDVAVLVAAVAAVISVAAIIWQARSARASRDMKFTLDVLLREITTKEFQVEQAFVLTQLSERYSPRLGISGLPIATRLAVWRVAVVYETMGILLARRMVDREVVMTLAKYRLCATFEVLYPYLQVERSTYRKAPYLPHFEHAYLIARDTDIRHQYARRKLRRVDESRPWGEEIEQVPYEVELVRPRRSPVCRVLRRA
jgi:hypothetical protein